MGRVVLDLKNVPARRISVRISNGIAVALRLASWHDP